MYRKILVSIMMILLVGAVAVPTFAEQKTVSILGVWGGHEKVAFMKALEPFEAASGIKVEFTGTRDLSAVLTTRVAAGNPPDISILPNPGQMEEFATIGELVDLSTFVDMDKLASDYGKTWLDLGSYRGKLYGIYTGASLKSLVWYNPKAFKEAGYKIPKTWDELIALSDRIVANGKAPWCIGLESGAASGWPGTDWIEDIMLRTAGPKVYDKWVNHEISWTDPQVKHAFKLFGQITRNEEYVYGGTAMELTANFGDAPDALFTSPPSAYMHKQATFITSFMLDHNPNLVAGTDFTFFPFPSIDPQYGTPALGGANVFVMFNNTPEAKALMRYLSTPGFEEILVVETGWLSPNRRVNLNVYPDELTRKAAQILIQAPIFRFDGSDLMPSSVGSGLFWTGILDYVSGEDLDSVLEKIENGAIEAYKK